MESDYAGLELFREEQRFSGAWLLPFALGVPALLVLVFGWGSYQQIIQHVPWGDRPLSDAGLIAINAVVLVVAIALPLLFLRSRLVVTVDREAVHIALTPFARRRVALAEIVAAQPRESHPLREFGGVGLRWTPRGWAYLVSGNMGVQFELASGKRIFVGSQRPDELAAAISSAKAAR